MGSNKCPKCGAVVGEFRNPFPVVDIIIKVASEPELKIVVIERKNVPYGWALPGGFIDYGESAKDAAIREAKEETSLNISDLELIGEYSEPKRDSRAHMISIAFSASAYDQVPSAQDDAKNIKVVTMDEALHMGLVFDHEKILMDYWMNCPYHY